MASITAPLRRIALFAVLGSSWAAPAAGSLDEWGVGAYSFTCECPSFCTNFLPPLPGSITQNATSAYAFHPDERGLAESSVQLAPTGAARGARAEGVAR
jgi:hypothetical protein